MNPVVQELLDIEQLLKEFITKATQAEVSNPVRALETSAKEVGRAWSRSWIGYHANVYYEDLKPPPPGAHFSSEWGFYEAVYSGSAGEWHEFAPDDVIQHIRNQAEQPDISQAE